MKQIIAIGYFIGQAINTTALRKTFYSRHYFLLPALLLLPTSTVLAAANDSITSTATINYSIGGAPGVDSASVSFVEDRKLNFNVTDNNGSAIAVISNMTRAVLQFEVQNTGNSTQDFLLTAENTSPNPYGLPADNFDPLNMQVFVESGITPGYQPLEDTDVFIDELPVVATAVVYVVADMPALSADDLAAVALIAQIAEGGASGIEGAAINADDNGNTSPAGVYSNGATSVVAGVPSIVPDDPNNMETVFSDPAGLDPEDISTALIQDVASNGQHADAGAYQQTSPVLINKTVTVIDTQGGNDPHPGATLRYQLDVSVIGNVPVDNLVITDVIPANTTYTDGSISLNGTAQTDASDAPVDYSRAIDINSKPVVSIEVDLSQGGSVAVAPGSSNTIIFEVTID